MRSAQGRLRDGSDLSLDSSFDWRRADLALPFPPEPLPVDADRRQRWERAALTWLRLGQPAAAQELRDLSLGLAQAQAELAPRAFWKISAAFFEMLGSAASSDAADPDAAPARKRALAGILQQCAASARGAHQPPPALARSLLAQCGAAIDDDEAAEAEFDISPDAAAAPLWAGLRQAYAAAPAHVSEAWLNAADEASQQLEAALAAWAVTPQLPLPPNAVPWAWSLAVRAGDVGLAVLAEFAEALARALQAALRGVDAEQAQLLANAAEHLRHLLHQHAAGFEKTPQPALLQALRAAASRTTA